MKCIIPVFYKNYIFITETCKQKKQNKNWKKALCQLGKTLDT